MKTSFLFLLIACVSFSSHSQNSKLVNGFKGVPASVKSKPVKADHTFISKENNIPYRTETQLSTSPIETKIHQVSTFTEATIGNTRYDLQSFRGTAKCITNNGDGTLSAVWTISTGPAQTWPDRGTGYNYFDGTNWGPTPITRIESIRTGYPNIAYTTSGGEFVCVHTASHGMLSSHRASKGVGAWDTATVGSYNIFPSQADVWSRMAVGGANGNTLHVIVNSQGTGVAPVLGQNGPLTYSRSQDGGITWDKDHVQIPGTDSAFMYGVDPETYHIDARGDVIAVVTAGFTNDVVLFKSLDNGTTWTRTVILPFPLGQPYNPTTMNTDTTGDGIGEEIASNQGDVTVTIDNNNVCQVAFGHMFIYEDSSAGIINYHPDDNTGLYYWHEGMSAPIIIAAAEDFNGNGVIDIPTSLAAFGASYGLYNIGFIGQPSIGVDVNNNIYIAYSAIDERADTTRWAKAMRHIFVTASFDGGFNWTTPYTINPNPVGYFIEAVWPSVATLIDSCVHIVYQRDSVPDNSVTENCPGPIPCPNEINPSDIVYACVPVSELVSLKENNNTANEWVTLNYPNPVKDFTSINVTLIKTSGVTFEITNVLGQLEYSLKQKSLEAGVHNIKIDATHLDAGIYFYTVSVADKKVSRKMIVE